MSGSDEKPGWSTSPAWMKAILVVSLALNLAVAGLIGGNAIREWREASFATATAEPGLDRRQTRILQMVPEARQDQAKAILMGQQDELDQAKGEMREAHMAFIAAIREEPLDPDKLGEALARRHAASSAFWRVGMEQVAEIARALNAAERAELADRFEERTKRWMARWDRKKR